MGVATMSVYILHLERPFGSEQSDEQREAYGLPPRKRAYKAVAQHYIGATADNSGEAVHERLHTHYKGHGSRMIAAAMAQGIKFAVAQVFPEGDFELERQLKARKKTKAFCPICKGEHEFVAWEPETGEGLAQEFFGVQAAIGLDLPF